MLLYGEWHGYSTTLEALVNNAYYKLFEWILGYICKVIKCFFLNSFSAKLAPVKHAHYKSRDRCTDSESPWEGRVLMWRVSLVCVCACACRAEAVGLVRHEMSHILPRMHCETLNKQPGSRLIFFFTTTTTTTVIINVSIKIDFCLQVGFEMSLLLNYILQCTLGKI